MSLSLPIFAGSNGESLSLTGRIINNFEFKWKVFYGNNLKLKILTNWYLFLIPLSIFAFYTKKYLAAYYASAALLLCFFIDFTKLTIAFDWRYLSVNYALICIAIFFLVQNKKVLQTIFTIVIVLWFGRTFFQHDVSYSKDIRIWSIEHKNLYQGKPAKIHPKNWQIEIKK